MKYLTWPAPDGAGTTLRYEAFCEGIQFAEAMIVVSQAVDTNAEALGKEKADAFHQVLVDLVQQARSRTKGPLQPADQGFQDVIKRLFDAAAECAKLGPAKPAAK